MNQTEKINTLTSMIDKVNNDIKVLENVDGNYFKNGEVLEVSVRSSLYGTISVEKISTSKSAKKYITPLLEQYQNKITDLKSQLTDVIKEVK